MAEASPSITSSYNHSQEQEGNKGFILLGEEKSPSNVFSESIIESHDKLTPN